MKETSVQIMAIAQKIIQPIGAQARCGLFKQWVIFFMKKGAPVVTMLCQNDRDITGEELRLFPFFVIALTVMSIDDVIDDMAESGVAHIVQQCGHLLGE